jgi:nitrogen regulatory protein PII
MHTVKRIEIIADSFELGKILDALKKTDVPEHIVIRNVVGHGFGGENLDVAMLDNVYIIAFCPPEKIKNAIEILQPLLNKFGGACYVSDASEIRSIKCVASM